MRRRTGGPDRRGGVGRPRRGSTGPRAKRASRWTRAEGGRREGGPLPNLLRDEPGPGRAAHHRHQPLPAGGAIPIGELILAALTGQRRPQMAGPATGRCPWMAIVRAVAVAVTVVAMEAGAG